MTTKAPAQQTKMQAERKVPPKPESLKKKDERNAKYTDALQKAREARRVSNKTKRADILKRSQTHLQNFQTSQKQENDLRRQAKLAGSLYVPAQSKVAFVIRIRGINKLNPKVTRILRLLRLRQIHNGVFVRLNKASINMLRRVEPYITYGYPSRTTVSRLVYKRGFGKLQNQRIPLSSNSVIESGLAKHNIISAEDLINEISNVGASFKEANNFLWPFKLTPPRGGFHSKRHPIQRGGDWGNREDLINELVNRML